MNNATDGPWHLPAAEHRKSKQIRNIKELSLSLSLRYTLRRALFSRFRWRDGSNRLASVLFHQSCSGSLVSTCRFSNVGFRFRSKPIESPSPQIKKKRNIKGLLFSAAITTCRFMDVSSRLIFSKPSHLYCCLFSFPRLGKEKNRRKCGNGESEQLVCVYMPAGYPARYPKRSPRSSNSRSAWLSFPAFSTINILPRRLLCVV